MTKSTKQLKIHDDIQQTNNSESNDKSSNQFFQVTNDPDIDEYTTDIW